MLSITAIATAAGVDRRTVYRRFAGRDELLAAVYQARLTGIEKAIRGARFAEAPVPVALHSYVEAIVGVNRRWPVELSRMRSDPVVRERRIRAVATVDAFLQADLARWPVECGRVHLAFGEWQRRELRSTGRTSPDQGPEAREKLAPHELSIARLAAEGLTNREIGRRLYLSHRTVGTHLHRIFPKLGVTFRVDLARALPAVPPNCSSASMV